MLIMPNFKILLTFFLIICYDIDKFKIRCRRWNVLIQNEQEMSKMFEIGQFIIYGSTGVCKVVDIGALNMDGISKDRLYYTLEPCYTKGSRVLTPTDNTKTIMRSVMSREEADALLHDFSQYEMIDVKDERRREEFYKKTISTCDCSQLIRLLKTIAQRRKERIANGRKVPVSDERYFKMAEDYLMNELAVVYKKSREDVREYVYERIKDEI